MYSHLLTKSELKASLKKRYDTYLNSFYRDIDLKRLLDNDCFTLTEYNELKK